MKKPPPKSIRDVYRQVQRAALLGLVLNLILGLVKLIGGWLGDSFALIADSVNSLGDVTSTLIVLIALRVAQRPADPEHPYGHTRAEGIAAISVAILIVVSGFTLVVQSVTHLGDKHGIPPVWTLWIAASNIVIKELLYWHNRRVGMETGSASLIANAWDHRSDALCAAAVLLGLTVIRIGGEPFLWADEVASLIVAGSIVFSGSQLFISSASELMDLQANPELIAHMKAVAKEVPGVREIETLWVRKSGLEYFADMHIEVDRSMTIEEGHRIGHQVKDKLVNEFTTLQNVLVHLEPHPHEKH